jgi:hypothetical protein
MAGTVLTDTELLAEIDAAIVRLIRGAKFITVNGQQFHYSSLMELRELRKEVVLRIAETAGTDGRGAWEASFSEQD